MLVYILQETTDYHTIQGVFSNLEKAKNKKIEKENSEKENSEKYGWAPRQFTIEEYEVQ